VSSAPPGYQNLSTAHWPNRYQCNESSYRGGTTQVAFDRGGHPSVDFIARLAALARARSDQNPGSMERGRPVPLPRRPGPQPPMARVAHSSWAWQGTEEGCKCQAKDTSRESCSYDLGAQRLKRVFNIDREVCGRCGDVVRVIFDASNRCIEDQETIDKVN